MESRPEKFMGDHANLVQELALAYKRYYFILSNIHIVWAHRAFLLLLTKFFLLSSKATLTDNLVHLAYDNHLLASFCYTNESVLGKLFNLRHSLL